MIANIPHFAHVSPPKKKVCETSERARKGKKKKKISPEPEPARQSHRATEQD
jgi:hypothetical protein